MPSSWSQNLHHVVFSTRLREPIIATSWSDRLSAFFGGIARDLNSQLLAGNGMADHVHLLVRFAADVAPAVLVRELKSRSSKWIHEAFDKNFAWQRGYGGFTVSRSNMDEVEACIRNQVEHHRTMTIKEEFVRFLERHGIEYNPE